MIFYWPLFTHTNIYLSNSYLWTVIQITWVYVGFAKGGFEILWCEYLWVGTHPCGGYGGSPPRKFRNMKCSRSDSRPIFHKESKKNS